VRDGGADALFSAGHTGASVLASHAAFGPLPGGWTSDVLFVRFYFSGKRQ